MVVGGGEIVEGEAVISMNPVPEKMDGKSLLVRPIEIMESCW